MTRRIQATTFDGGFSLRLRANDDGDLGKALHDVEGLVVEMEDGRVLNLYEAVATMIKGRVTEITVATEIGAKRFVWPVLATDSRTTAQRVH